MFVILACSSNLDDNIMMASRVGSARDGGVAGGGANWAGSKDFGGTMFISGGGWSGEMNNGVSAGFEEILWSDFFVIRILAENEEISS